MQGLATATHSNASPAVVAFRKPYGARHDGDDGGNHSHDCLPGDGLSCCAPVDRPNISSTCPPPIANSWPSLEQAGLSISMHVARWSTSRSLPRSVGDRCWLVEEDRLISVAGDRSWSWPRATAATRGYSGLELRAIAELSNLA